MSTTLATAVQELFERFETQTLRNRQEIVDDYFIELAKRQEMNMVFEKPGYYAALKSTVERDVLPLYEHYATAKRKILETRKNRTLTRYVLGTILVLQVVQLIFTRGRAMMPTVLFPSLAIEALIGMALYHFVRSQDQASLRAAQDTFFANAEGLDRRLLVDREYDAFKEMWGGQDALRAEVYELLSHYRTPEDFWRDYKTVRRADPMNDQQRKQLNIPAFDKFLQFHVSAAGTDQAREHRFNALFILASEMFVNAKGHEYVETVLPTETPSAMSEDMVKPRKRQHE